MDAHSHIHLPSGVLQLHTLRAEETPNCLSAPKNDKMGQGVKLQICCALKAHKPDFKIR